MVVFQTAEGLSPDDSNNNTDVYEWHDGLLSQVSGVGGGQLPWITLSGRDIFFVTGGQLTADDGDNVGDVYDARVGGGFDLRQPASCSGEVCHGQPSAAPGLVGPLSTAPDGGPAADVAPAFSLRAVSKRQLVALAATGKVTLVVTTNTPGTVSVTARAIVAGKSTTVATSRRDLASSGVVAVPVTLSKRARGQLAARGKLAVTIAVSHSKVALDRSVTLRLSHAKAKKKPAKHSRAKRSAADVGRARS
jgi:hypothetical protein